MLSAVGGVVLSLPVFLGFSIEWDATWILFPCNGNLLLDFWSCSYFTLLSGLELGAQSKGNELLFFFMLDH